MSDQLTQIQTCLDQLATQMYASLHYISTHHSSSQIEGQPYHGTSNAATSQPASTQQGGDASPPAPNGTDADGFRPDSPSTFKAALRELSTDLVAKEQQIEALIDSIPGTKTSREQQEERIKELQSQLSAMEDELNEAKHVKEGLVERVEFALVGVKRVR